MVINADELDLDWLLWAVVGLGVGVLMAAVVIAFLAHRLGGRRFGIASVSLGLVVAIAVLVDVVVLRRTASGDVTVWDLLWAVGLAGAAAWCLRSLCWVS